jgi:PhoH-like ATPase
LAFTDNEVIIPLVVIEELDTFKDSENEKGRNARHVTRTLDSYRELGNLNKGIRLPNGGLLRVELNCVENVPPQLDQQKVDNRIIGVALGLAARNTDKQVVLVSKDINMRVKCDSLGVESQDYQKDRMVDTADELFSGFAEILVSDEDIDTFHDGQPLTIEEALYPNQFILLKSAVNKKKTALAKYVAKKTPLKRVLEQKDIWGINARNKEQTFALNLLMDTSINLVSLIGLAGSGKTLLSIAAALEQTVENETYKRIIVSRPVQPMGKDLGYLPGSIDEKMAPWIAPLNDNLEFLFEGNLKTLEMFKESGIIQVEAITYIRGRSIPNSFIIIDEAQNLSIHELKTIITRAGEGSKIVLTGDIEQIDSPYLDSVSNGLSVAVEKFKEYGIAGHITLRAGVRSELATLAAKIL